MDGRANVGSRSICSECHAQAILATLRWEEGDHVVTRMAPEWRQRMTCPPLGSCRFSWHSIFARSAIKLRRPEIAAFLEQPGSKILHDGPPVLRIARLAEERERFLG